MWLLIFKAAHVCALSCFEYSCRSKYDDFYPGQCIKSEMSEFSTNLTLTIDTCNDPFFSYCPPVDFNASCQLPPQTPYINIAYVGEKCTIDENCVSSICYQGICKGLELGSQCSNDFQCNVGLYCDGNCKNLNQIGYQCTRDEECMNDLTCINGKCDHYFSLDQYETVPVCVNQVNFQCSSGGCYEESGNFQCLPIVESLTLPLGCVMGMQDQCKVNLSNVPNGQSSTYQTKCMCSQNGYATSSCTLATGDDLFIKYTDQVSLWLKSSKIDKCHTTQRFSLKCVEENWDYKNFVKLAYFENYALNYPQYVYSDSCVQNVFQTEFRKIEAAYLALDDKDDDSSSYSVILRLAVAVMFILIN